MGRAVRNPAAGSFADVVRAHARSRPDAPALTFGARTWTFAELDAASSRAANALRARGVGAGDRVAILARNRAEYFALIHGANKIGATLVCLNWRLAPREIAEILADAEPALVLADDTGATLLPGDAEAVRLGPEFDAMCEAAGDADPGHAAAPDEVALILYTSGTTGRPKGVMLTHEGLGYTRALADAWGMGPGSVNLVAMPLFHIGGCGYGSSTMLAGGHTVLMADVDVGAIVERIARHRVTHTFMVPAVVQALLGAPEAAEVDMGSMELLMYGAAPMGDVLLRRAMTALGCRFMHAYGMTEASGTVVCLGPEEHDPDGPLAPLLKSCGTALPWVELRVVDPATGRDRPAGEVGEIWLRTPMLMRGYWRNPEATAEVLVEDGWFRTGDAAFLDEAGHVFLFDRYKDMIISGGENIYPAEIENVLNGHAAVAQVGVIGVPHPRWGETPLAVVVPKPGTAPTEAELLDHVRASLARYKCPSWVVFAESLPRNASGKVLKHELRRAHGASR
ncbi:long-chain-fatty-acid--CoA ligase [Jannaschia sp. W003]|uniref:long-chain-fatty-acid--CoA ligase n=1 Tax=Jannaschia sp. W003 TaxID=2867012 RepID=UPI0021A7A61F|nr:long-chain-fatty-acid--CoA ligase [Jannaschia sp. W003]UWQ21795.1 long-chain-fatty-acid--CoA ligase [Jannaschia sp. W003]